MSSKLKVIFFSCCGALVLSFAFPFYYYNSAHESLDVFAQEGDTDTVKNVLAADSGSAENVPVKDSIVKIQNLIQSPQVVYKTNHEPTVVDTFTFKKTQDFTFKNGDLTLNTNSGKIRVGGNQIDTKNIVNDSVLDEDIKDDITLHIKDLVVSDDAVIEGSLKVNGIVDFVGSGIDFNFSNGSVVFAGSDGRLTENNAQFFWNNTNKRLGIGTAAPEAKLHIAGLTYQTGLGQSTYFGYEAGKNDDLTNNQNSGFGYQALTANTTGTGNTASGYQALTANTTGDRNTALGGASLYLNTTGNDNVGIGTGSLLLNTSGSNNTAIGKSSLLSNSGSNNIAIGLGAGDNITTGSNNLIIGYDIDAPSATGSNQLSIGNLIYGTGLDGTGITPSTGNIGIGTSAPLAKLHIAGRVYQTGLGESTFFGYEAGKNDDLTTNQNSAFGYQALTSNTTGSGNTASGYRSLYSNTTGGFNITSGNFSLYYNTTGSHNGALGANALLFNTTGNFNMGIGTLSLFSNTTGEKNTAIGILSLGDNTTGSQNTAIGYNAGEDITTGIGNTAIGNEAMQGLAAGSYNIAIGYGVGLPSNGSNELSIGNLIYGTGLDGSDSTISTGNIGIGIKAPEAKLHIAGRVYQTGLGESTFFGYEAGKNDDLSTNQNSGFGYQALTANTTGTGNTASGYQSLYFNTSGFLNTASGYQSLYFNTTGDQNTASGYRSLYFNTTGDQNTASGYWSLQSNTTGDQNTALGYRSLYSNTIGFINTALGNESLLHNTTGIGNTASGHQSLYFNTTGNFNVAFGDTALASNTTGSNNIAIGLGAGDNITTGSNNLIIGYDIDAPSATGSNQLSIGNLIYGTGLDGTGITPSTGNIGIGVNAPTAQLHTTGSVRFATFGAGTLQTDASGNLSVSSDERLKNITGNFDKGLTSILAINPIQYHWKQETGYDTENLYTGFSAQNIQKTIPEAVGVDEDGYLTLNDRPIIAALINATKEQQLELDFHEKNFSSLNIDSNKNITTLSELQNSMDERFTIVDSVLQKSADANEKTESILTELDKKINTQSGLIVALEEQLNALKLEASTETQITQLTAHTEDISLIKLLLGIDRVLNPEDIHILGKITARTLETGGITITAEDEEAKTIGTAILPSGAKEVIVKTHAISKDSKVFVTPISEKPVIWSVSEKKNGESFTLTVDEIVEEETGFDWWIIEEK